MSTKETKPNDDKQSTDKQAQPVDKVAATYAATEKSLADIETKAVAARREVRELSEGYARAQEERQRANAQWDYEEEQRRRGVVDKQKEEDRKRELAHIEREAKIKERETTVNTTLAKLLGIASDPFNPEAAKTAFDAKLKTAEDNGKNIAAEIALKEYATKKAIDDATAATKTVRLEDENARLKLDNAKLEAENKRLFEVNTDLAKRQGDLARDAFGSAGGTQRQALDSLQTAAQSGQRPVGR